MLMGLELKLELARKDKALAEIAVPLINLGAHHALATAQPGWAASAGGK
jgi:hypothetical protein